MDMRQRKKGTKGIRKVGTGTTTITHATFSGGGVSASLRACSRALVQKFDGGFVKGRNIGQKGGYTTVCGKPFKYRKGGIPKSRHTEAKILDTLFKAVSPMPAGASLTMAINWNNSATPEDPCPDCKRMICAATECIDIKLCKEGKPVEPDCK
jgi:hypothetical protein